MMLRSPCLALVLLALGAYLHPPIACGKLEEAQWKEVRKEALRLMKEPGQRFAKLKAVDAIGRDDSRRAAELLVRWTLRSLKLQQGPLGKLLEQARKDFEKVDALMRRAYDEVPPPRWRSGADQQAWKGPKEKLEAAQLNYDIEDAVRYGLADALQNLRDPHAVTYLIDEGLPTVRKARDAELVEVAIVRGLFRQPQERVLRTALVLGRDASRPKVRILAINWFGQHQVAQGQVIAENALGAREVAVQRAAVMALTALDDNRSVKPLIDSMAGADGQLRVEIDEALFRFTGQSFEGQAAVWKRWWDEHGEAWLASGPSERFRRARKVLPGGTRVRFYGIPTESHHVVFVLDRSGSMKEPAGEKSRPKPKRKPRGPVTGGGRKPPAGDGKEDEPIEGDTKIEVAKNQLARSIDQLDKRVKFNVVFYSKDVQVWQEPPRLLESTKSNKQEAKTWFMGLEAQGPTLLFPALHKALEYADTIKAGEKRPRTGADTIFLLSDGSPTTADGKVLPPEELETQYRRFLEANQLYHCIVHTIGVGPQHNRTLMQRIARDTGGKYKAVGAD